jgi:transcriptional regulator GlxA family with amidase domain
VHYRTVTTGTGFSEIHGFAAWRRACVVLAEAGLLGGRCVTTHWRASAQLAQRYPDLTVDPDPIFVRDGQIYTSAGITAGMDLALALVEEDHGCELALKVARDMVLFLRRPGGQSQFNAQLAPQAADREPIRDGLRSAPQDDPHRDSRALQLGSPPLEALTWRAARGCSRVG